MVSFYFCPDLLVDSDHLLCVCVCVCVCKLAIFSQNKYLWTP